MNPILPIMFVVQGLVLIGLSIPLIQQRIPPNHWYGFRVPRTLRDPGIWYSSNTYAAWRLLWVGVATVVTATAACFIPEIKLEVYATIVGVVAVTGLIIAVVQSFWYLGTLSAGSSDSTRR